MRLVDEVRVPVASLLLAGVPEVASLVAIEHLRAGSEAGSRERLREAQRRRHPRLGGASEARVEHRFQRNEKLERPRRLARRGRVVEAVVVWGVKVQGALNRRWEEAARTQAA
jgi:hypothetical protein